MVAEKFKIYGVYILWVKQLSLFIFSHAPSKTLPQVFIITTPSRSGLPISPEQCFLKIYFSPAERGEDYGAEKLTQMKLARVLGTSFDIFHYFCNLYILASVLLCHNLDSGMLKCESSLT